MSNTLDKSLHKILIWMVKTIPIIMAISYVIDDILMYMGMYIFNRFYADVVFMDNPIDWDEMI